MSKKNNLSPEVPTCSFCGRTEDDVERLISGPQVYICDHCVRLCVSVLEKKPSVQREFRILKPQRNQTSTR